ncbi:hypothetical protein V6N11_059819 [Hibiscus sabdariffa]|uniref:Uncharacterized protein n=1 Tax=Hibiscus sabdariffa TaxID=183260 RepID=A0ABR2NY52_9ROSI
MSMQNFNTVWAWKKIMKFRDELASVGSIQDDYKAKPVRYFCNGDLLVNKGAANWRDSIAFDFHDSQLDPQLFPPICREAVIAPLMLNLFITRETKFKAATAGKYPARHRLLSELANSW